MAAGSPCASIYVPAFPRTAAGPPPFVPLELSSEELWHAADTLRQRVEADPDALAAVREVLQPVEDELWADADDVLETRPLGRRRRVVGQPGPPRAAVLRRLNREVPQFGWRPAVRCGHRQCAPTRQGGSS